MKPLNISLPPGVKDSLPDEASTIENIEKTILSVMEQCGFQRVITPFLEYLDVLSIGLGADLRDKVFKFIDPATGKIVAIRPDITPQIARVVATRMRDYKLPLRICYNEKIFRYQEPRSGRPREIQQIGAELITKKNTPDADAEIITIAINSLKGLGLKDFKIDIGEVGFVKGCIDNLKIDDKERGNIKNAIALKDGSALEAILNNLGKKVGDKDKKAINLIPSLFGGEEILEKALSIAFNRQAKTAVENLSKILQILNKKGFKKFITFDMAEIRGFDYYTGIIFEGFAQGVGKAIVAGGRYDSLMQKYGYPCAAIGFAFDVENVVAALEG
ncbi:MAG: ATP phosphoribosyltransferase regulatory subunit [Deltaproteobacteria bacterium RIFCSPLOWO2_12_FULL_43_16]|nr:MAG: ATP phosphoribosyltransferase regulatory subunit [Deltaproteobacteria bacterium GWA2_43_19]OGQ10072.1 MAG: ATP phosphoribosyltransferase regulatory subunit [Deltaproteobacteria bacterium RIFCSPHIGHO2_02_FULL_43_33]OGQ59055.1 MAG: ATP phosphoribosyltransferase regulatory subunit [Deltaproteobacteria bacterium RIFCSPLOWO2_12_FULL_43_16]HBR18458.1 ATP phosphoribosyltransferase regulatory subunit [Deltaproteobacteria bacterium]